MDIKNIILFIAKIIVFLQTTKQINRKIYSPEIFYVHFPYSPKIYIRFFPCFPFFLALLEILLMLDITKACFVLFSRNRKIPYFPIP